MNFVRLVWAGGGEELGIGGVFVWLETHGYATHRVKWV